MLFIIILEPGRDISHLDSHIHSIQLFTDTTIDIASTIGFVQLNHLNNDDADYGNYDVRNDLISLASIRYMTTIIRNNQDYPSPFGGKL